MGDGLVEAIRSIGPFGALLAILTSIMAAVIRAIIAGALIPRASHEQIVNGYRERAILAETREQWWREQAWSENRVTDRTLDVAADLATRHTLRRPPRGGNNA